MYASTIVVLVHSPREPSAAEFVADFIANLPEDVSGSVYLAGTAASWAFDDWRADVPLTPSLGFVAPVMRSLRTRLSLGQCGSILIAGTEEIIDLEDWLDNGMRWAWVQVSKNVGPPPSVTGRIPVFSPDRRIPLLDWLRNSPAPLPPRILMPTGFIKHQWRLDRTGFPMVYVDSLQAYVHIFPCTKSQFEHFIAEARLPKYDEAWYADLLKLQPRLSPSASSLAEYEQLFVTGLLPEDVQVFVNWHGQGARLLTVEQWRSAFVWLAQQDLSTLPFELEREMSLQARKLWAGLLIELQPRDLLGLSLMKDGVVEWVEGPGREPLGMGQPRESFQPTFHDALRDKPLQPTSLTRRSKLFGFRLMISG